jgi:L,D-transpeptidase YbiS
MRYLLVDTREQELSLISGGNILNKYCISTGIKGLGEDNGSGQTPRGWHCIRAKIGAGMPMKSVFVGRRPTGEICTPQLYQQYPDRDWILSRILWLSGLEPGINRLSQVDSFRRYIYLHGCADEASLGKPVSGGCIRMANIAIMDLFEQVQVGDKILICS